MSAAPAAALPYGIVRIRVDPQWLGDDTLLYLDADGVLWQATIPADNPTGFKLAKVVSRGNQESWHVAKPLFDRSSRRSEEAPSALELLERHDDLLRRAALARPRPDSVITPTPTRQSRR